MMPPVLHLLLLVLALGCFILASIPSTSPNWNRLVSVGLGFLVASMISW